MKTILVHSYKGGAGKTTISSNLAVQLSKTSKVLLIETDFKMPSFFGVFNSLKTKYYMNDFYKDTPIPLDDCIVQYNTQLDIISANPVVDPQDPVHSWDKRWHATRLRRLKEGLTKLDKTKSYDFAIFDTPPGAHFLVINNIALANDAIIVVRPNSLAVEGTFKMIEELYFKTKNPAKLNLYLLFNQIPRVPMTKELDEWTIKAKKFNMREVGRIPCSCEGVYQMSKGINIFDENHEIITYMTSMINILKGEEILSIPDPTLTF